jgi:hypothetical protein
MRATRLVGVAPILWTAVGQAVATTAPSVRPRCKPKGQHLSLLRVGIPYAAKLALLTHIGVRCIQACLTPSAPWHLTGFVWGLKRHHTLSVKIPLDAS